jgi:tRNA pseudouridine38-40 synthase
VAGSWRPAGPTLADVSEDPATTSTRVRLDLAYDGTPFAGWAAQPGLRTVEGELASALSTVLRLPSVRLVVAGRTDAGVHARAQVAHVDVPSPAWSAVPGRSAREPGPALVTRLAGVLPREVVVRSATVAPAGFDARFSATSRRYSYRLCDDPTTLDPLRRLDTVLARRPLDAAAMQAAAQGLLGLRDFAAFCKKREGATTVRTLLEYSWRRGPDGVLEATVVADAFCHSMVRALVGVVVPVGEGRVPPSWSAQVLAAGRRDPGVQVMAPHGLVLEQVTYPPEAELGVRAREARAVRTL